jgi:hypothetical protein
MSFWRGTQLSKGTALPLCIYAKDVPLYKIVSRSEIPLFEVKFVVAGEALARYKLLVCIPQKAVSDHGISVQWCMVMNTKSMFTRNITLLTTVPSD